MLTEHELIAEQLYRTKERLGILCGSNAPNAEAYEIARAEVEAWAAEQRGEFFWQRE